MSRSCMDCERQHYCSAFDTVDADKCEEYAPFEISKERNSEDVSELVKNKRQESIELLKKEVPNHTNIENLIKYLTDKSEISLNGKMRTDTSVNKEALRLAAVYLQDYYDLMDHIAHQPDRD